MPLNLPAPPASIFAWGIDLGTTNSTLCCASLPTGATSPTEPEIVALPQQTIAGTDIGSLLPSMVAIHEGREFVGQGAKGLRALMADPKYRLSRNVNLFYECKNEIGTARHYPSAPPGYRSPTEIAARILAYIRREGIREGSVDNVVVTVPASFQAAQRAETVKACAAAGLNVSGGRLLDEPVAAFIDYAYRHDPALLDSVADRSRLLLVFDFGGGTCDIALFGLARAASGQPVQVSSRSVSRFHRLGGGDIDLAILHKILLPQLCRENGLSEFELTFQDKTRVLTPALIAVAEALKTQICNEIWRLQQFGKLATTPRAEIVACYPRQVSMRCGERTLTLSSATISAEEFDAVLDPFLSTEHLFARSTEYRLENSIFAPIADALDRAGLETRDVDHVLAVGGSALIPQVIDALQGYFPHARLLQYEDRKDAQLAIARGASLHALALSAGGQGIVCPVAQDDIYLVTQGGYLQLLTQGAPLPFPAESVASSDSLSVPEDAFEQALELSVELVAGAERRLLFRDHWDIAMVRRGSPLRLEYAYDENQVFHLQLTLADFPESVPFTARIENPLSHVVNPNRTQEEIDRLEEEYRRDPQQADELIPRIAELCADLGQHDKAIGLVRALLRQANRPVAWLLNRQAMYEEARGNRPAAMRDYEEAARNSGDWAGPLFNLALLHERQHDYAAALRAIERAMQRDDTPPYQTLKLRISKRLHAGQQNRSAADRIVADFGNPEDLDEWELGWYIAAADLANNKPAGDSARNIRRQRGRGIGAADRCGKPPAIRGMET